MLNDLRNLYEAISNPQEHTELEERLKVDIRSLYRHEHISPELLMQTLFRYVENKPDESQLDLFSVNELFGNTFERDELEKVPAYYRQPDGCSNRLIQGDSLLVMTSLLEREGMAGKVQMIYFDPPYGIKYGGNWQMKLNSQNVVDGKDDHLSGEPEQIRAYRDTWESGIHSYLSYLKERLIIAKELISETGSCFIQISDENVHLVRNLMDEIFGSENSMATIILEKTQGRGDKFLSVVNDYILWYTTNQEVAKYNQLYLPKKIGGKGATGYVYLEAPDRKSFRTITKKERLKPELIPSGWKLFDGTPLVSESGGETTKFDVEFEGKIYTPKNNFWKTNKQGFKKLLKKGRIVALGNRIEYKRYFDDFPVYPMHNIWTGLGERGFVGKRQYIVQTDIKAIQRCLLMTTDPGDLVLDPTCGSGTTAYVAEQWGRRWITIDTSRIAVNIAKTRLMTAVFPYYELYDQQGDDIRQGFIYKKVPHITLKALANDEPFDEETLYDQPQEDKKKIRVAGPFTVETLQSFEPVSPESLDQPAAQDGEAGNFEERIFEHLKSAGVKNGIKNEQAVFTRIDRLSSSYLHAEGFYQSAEGECKAYLHIGPKFGSVSKQAVNEAMKECRKRGDGDWLIILGFSFESNIENQSVTQSVGSFEVTKVRMHDDLMQEGLLKKDKKAASFVTVGEPDIALHRDGNTATVEIQGLDIYDPIKSEVKERSIADIAYWMVDDDYDGSNFVVKQIFFCGGDKNEFDKWQKGLESLAKSNARKKAEFTLSIEIDEEAFDRLYGFKSHPITVKPGQRIAVRVISQFGEESTKVVVV
ncbi:MAG: site-specific DNA-methyltransferase [Saprospiraceae bacterium]